MPVRNGIVLCTTRMNRIIKIDEANFTATVEAGVVLNELNSRDALFGELDRPLDVIDRHEGFFGLDHRFLEGQVLRGIEAILGRTR